MRNSFTHVALSLLTIFIACVPVFSQIPQTTDNEAGVAGEKNQEQTELIAEEVWTIHMNDHETLVPAYPMDQLEWGMTGVIKVRLDFDKGKVTKATILSSDLKSQRGYPENADRIIYTMKKWTSWALSPFSTEVTVQLKLDSTLTARERKYEIETDNHGIVTNLVMVGPVLEKLKNRIETKK